MPHELITLEPIRAKNGAMILGPAPQLNFPGLPALPGIPGAPTIPGLGGIAGLTPAGIINKFAALTQPTQPLPRYFGSITAMVTFQEQHTDRLTLTQHPVEQGAKITDHAYMEPLQVEIHFGASNSSMPQTNGINDYLQSLYRQLVPQPGGGGSTIDQLYKQLQTLQASRTPFNIQTGKRLYKNMLITSMEVTTDNTSEYALMVTVTCTEVIIVSTSIVINPPDADQAQPQKTGDILNSGAKQLQNITPPANPPLGQPAPTINPPLGLSSAGALSGGVGTQLGPP